MITKRQSFDVSARVTIDCGITIKAASLKEAIELASELSVQDFVEVKDQSQYLESNFRVTGVQEDYKKIPEKP